MSEIRTIGFIGVGVMGKGMVRNLLKAGFEVYIWARRPETVQDVLADGARWTDSIAACVAGRDAVITIVGFPADVEEVYFAPGNILDSAKSGAYLIDMTTSKPALARRIHAAAAQRGLHALDAPVSGGDTGARLGTLSVMVGGDEVDFEACRPVFAAMGNNIVHHGPAGAGQDVKVTNQIMIAGALSGVSEAFAYARTMGLDTGKMLQSVATGAAGSRQLELYGQRIIDGDYAPGFFIKHFVKDMGIALEAAEDSELHLEVLETVNGIFETLLAQGRGEDGTQMMVEYYTGI